jgi:hypothetical protein
MCVAHRFIEAIEGSEIRVWGPLTLSDKKGGHPAIPSSRKAVAEKGLGGMHGLYSNSIDDPHIKGIELYIEVGLSFTSPIKVSEVAVGGTSENANEGGELSDRELIWMRRNRPSIGAKKPHFTG